MAKSCSSSAHTVVKSHDTSLESAPCLCQPLLAYGFANCFASSYRDYVSCCAAATCY